MGKTATPGFTQHSTPAVKKDQNKPRFDLIQIKAISDVSYTIFADANARVRDSLPGIGAITLAKDLLRITDADRNGSGLLPRALSIQAKMLFAASMAELEITSMSSSAYLVDNRSVEAMYPNALTLIAEVLAFGAEKYADRNWLPGQGPEGQSE